MTERRGIVTGRKRKKEDGREMLWNSDSHNKPLAVANRTQNTPSIQNTILRSAPTSQATTLNSKPSPTHGYTLMVRTFEYGMPNVSNTNVVNEELFPQTNREVEWMNTTLTHGISVTGCNTQLPTDITQLHHPHTKATTKNLRRLTLRPDNGSTGPTSGTWPDTILPRTGSCSRHQWYLHSGQL